MSMAPATAFATGAAPLAGLFSSKCGGGVATPSIAVRPGELISEG
jgi:hypothetical protein